MRKSIRILLVSILVFGAASGAVAAAWWHSVDLASQPVPDARTLPIDLEFLGNAPAQNRGKILAVVTSTASAGDGAVDAGLELTELSRAYYVFKANGYEVEIASPQGGRPPVKIDEELIEADYAFLNDPAAQELLAQTLPMRDVKSADYAAVYFVGGKGAMFDFADNPAVQQLVAAIYDNGGVIGAVCHGPAALIGARLSDGTPFLADKTVAGFSNEEEFFLIANAREVFPFLLEDRLRREAGHYSETTMYLDHTIVDGRLVTGQNPWSTWSVAEGMIRALGHQTVERAVTREERAVELLAEFHRAGINAALAKRENLGDIDKRLVLLHAMIAAMEGRIGEAFSIQRLAH